MIESTKQMDNLQEIHVLAKFRPFLRLIEAFNSETLRHRSWYLDLLGICYVLCATIMLFIIPLIVILIVWYLIESGGEMRISVALIPIAISVVQFYLTFVALIVNNRIMSEAIDQIQEAVSRRKCLESSCRLPTATFTAGSPLFTRRLLGFQEIATIVRARWVQACLDHPNACQNVNSNNCDAVHTVGHVPDSIRCFPLSAAAVLDAAVQNAVSSIHLGVQ